jgi:hypothetical protein
MQTSKQAPEVKHSKTFPCYENPIYIGDHSSEPVIPCRVN